MESIRSRLLDKKGVVHGFGMGGYTLEDYLKYYNISNARHFTTDQMHSDDVLLLSHHLAVLPSHQLEADSFITNEPNIVCFVRTADCVPILIYDPVKRAIAAIHAGWRGTAKNIVAKTIERMLKEFDSRAGDLVVAIGPAIAENCYEVGEDVIDKFYSLPRPPPSRGREGVRGKFFLNLPAINRQLLIEAGVKHIDLIPICTHCDKRFASYRRDKSEKFRQFNFIVLLE
jgi:YfiH family protein